MLSFGCRSTSLKDWIVSELSPGVCYESIRCDLEPNKNYAFYCWTALLVNETQSPITHPRNHSLILNMVDSKVCTAGSHR